MMQRLPLPPFTLESAKIKVQIAQDGWNTKDPQKVAMAYTKDSRWRNRDIFINGREEIEAFLTKKWDKEQEYKLKKELWSYTDNKIAVKFEYEWHDESGQWYRSYGNELWEFDEDGYMKNREASINDTEIMQSQRYL